MEVYHVKHKRKAQPLPAYVDGVALRRRIGQRLRSKRIELSITQEDLGMAVGLTRSAVAYIECGKNALTTENALKFSQALGLSVEELFGSNE